MTQLTVNIEEDLAQKARVHPERDKIAEDAYRGRFAYEQWQKERMDKETLDFVAEAEAEYQEKKKQGYSEEDANRDLDKAMEEIEKYL